MLATVQGWTRSPYDEESGEVTLVAAGHRFTAQTRMIYESDWTALREGQNGAITLWLDRWHDHRGELRPAQASGAQDDRSGRLEVVDGVHYRLTGPVGAVDPVSGGSVPGFVVHLDVGLSELVSVQGYAPSEVDGLAIRGGRAQCLDPLRPAARVTPRTGSRPAASRQTPDKYR